MIDRYWRSDWAGGRPLVISRRWNVNVDRQHHLLEFLLSADVLDKWVLLRRAMGRDIDNGAILQLDQRVGLHAPTSQEGS